MNKYVVNSTFFCQVLKRYVHSGAYLFRSETSSKLIIQGSEDSNNITNTTLNEFEYTDPNYITWMDELVSSNSELLSFVENLPETVNGLSLPIVSSFTSIPWVRWFKADAITPLSDGASLSSWVDSAGSGDPMSQSTSGHKPLYKIASNGINGVPVVRFSGGQNMATLHGGAGIPGAFYMGVVVKFTSFPAYQHVVYFGSENTGHRRSIFLRGSKPEFNGYNADAVFPVSALSTGVSHFLEISYDGTYIWFYLDGYLVGVGCVSNPLATNSDDPIRLGANGSGGENLNGDIAEVMVLAGVPTLDQRSAIVSYITEKYGFSVSNTTSLLKPNNAMTGTDNSIISEANIGAQIDGPVMFGTATRAYSDPIQPPGTATYPVTYTFSGSFSFDSSGSSSDNLITKNSNNVNVFTIWNKSPAGYSAMRCSNSSGFDGMAIGVANSGSTGPFNRGSQGSSYIEACGDGTFAFVQTGAVGGAQKLRWEATHAGNIVWYGTDGTTIIRTEYPNGVTKYNGLSTSAINDLTPVEGMTVYDNVLHVWKFYNGTVWKTITTN